MMQAPPQANAPIVAGQQPPIAVPPAIPPVLPAANVPPTTYLDQYLDAKHDSFQGNYVNLYNEYAVGNTQPAPLRTAVYKAGNSGTFLHGLVHVRDPTGLPDDPGTIVAVHRLVRHESYIGQVPVPYDNLGLAFYGDVINGQAPTTVTIPDMWFNQTPVVQVPTHGRLLQEFALHPNMHLFGPYMAGEPDVTPIVTRPLMLVPNKYVTPFLTSGLSPKEAYQVLWGMIQQSGQQVACEPLLDWLRVAVTHRGGANPLPVTCVAPATPPAFANPGVQQLFNSYRLGTFHTDFPHFQPGHQHNSAALIAQGLSAITDEQRLARQEAQQRQVAHTAPKTPAIYLGVLLDKLMRWCQVPAETDLPPIYTTLANTKKGRMRVALQTAIEEALGNLRYVEDFPVSTTLAAKIQDLTWSSPIPDNFTLGINLFGLGSPDAESMAQQRQLNQHADALYGGDAAPSLLDIVAIQDSKQDVYIPRTFAHLRFLIERAEALWLVLLGTHHPVTQQYRAYRQYLGLNEYRLERITTSDSKMRPLVPALLGRRVQLATNAWLVAQAKVAMPVPHSDLSEIFLDIDLGKQWEAPFPAYYLTFPSALVPGPSATIRLGSSTSSTAASTLSAPSTITTSTGSFGSSTPVTVSTPVATTVTRETSIVRNVLYNEAVFGPYKALNIKAKTLKDQLRTRNVTYPVNARNGNMCLTYHVQGICNSGCRNAADHYAHSAAEDETFRAWCALHYKLLDA
jgi:hypothetical protein